jgi:hypothetical protein
MNVKVFQTNEKGKIEFTRCELEKLLNETYKDGYKDGCSEGEKHTKGDYWTWITPSLTNSNLTTPVCEQPKNSATKAALTPAESHATKATLTSLKNPAQTYDINVAKDLDLNLDLSGLAKTIDEILSGNINDSFFKHSSPSTPMNNLAKELCEL